MPPPRIRPMASSACLMKPCARPQVPLNDVIAAFRALSLQRSPSTRSFSTSPTQCDWLAPKAGESRKSPKGRVHVPTGGSIKGTTVVWGDYGLRLRSHDRRIPAQNLKIAEDTIKKRLRGTKFRMYTRVSANIGVYTSGNESRMGKGKGSFDHWATRCATGKVVVELKGEVHEQVVRDAFRLAGNKLPGLWEFVKKGDPPVMGMTKVGGAVTEEMLRRPRMKLPLEQTAARIPAAVPT